MMRERGLSIAYPQRTFATADHIVPTDTHARPFADDQAEAMMAALEKNVSDFGIEFYGLGSDRQGIVHVIGPQLGLTQPGMTLACGDSHTSTHGAFGTLAFGIGTTQVRDVLSTQTLSMDRLNVRRINVNGSLPLGVHAKDVILTIIRPSGVGGGKGYAYEYGGAVLDRMNMEERMTVCNMSIEGGALVGYVTPIRPPSTT
ncbi:3-isopropylmalate dehydratase large subunit [Geodia barretti]|nr:3-isopropylmalate dehydratase large subunit [Geodia barretti]